MSGAALAAVSGVGCGVFQSFNRRAVGGSLLLVVDGS
jgi:hypothetical protein